MKINRRVGINAFLIDLQYLRVSMLRLKEGEPGALYVAYGFARTPLGNIGLRDFGSTKGG